MSGTLKTHLSHSFSSSLSLKALRYYNETIMLFGQFLFSLVRNSVEGKNEVYFKYNSFRPFSCHTNPLKRNQYP